MTIPIADRFWKKVEESDGCWLWTGAVNGRGYGHIRQGGKDGPMVLAHRLAYEWAKGPIPPGQQIDHLCRVRRCVNPDHLEAVTQRVNILRGESPAAKLAGATHCQRGHEFTPENTRITPDRGGRTFRACRTCLRRSDALRRQRRRQHPQPNTQEAA